MNTFMYLVLAHLLLDYPLQGEFLALGKAKYPFLLVVHCLMWALGCATVLEWMGMYASWKLHWLFFGHLCMDYLKCKGYLDNWILAFRRAEARYNGTREAYSRTVDPLGSPLWIDQSFHIFQLFMCLTSWSIL